MMTYLASVPSSGSLTTTAFMSKLSNYGRILGYRDRHFDVVLKVSDDYELALVVARMSSDLSVRIDRPRKIIDPTASPVPVEIELVDELMDPQQKVAALGEAFAEWLKRQDMQLQPFVDWRATYLFEKYIESILRSLVQEGLKS